MYLWKGTATIKCVCIGSSFTVVSEMKESIFISVLKHGDIYPIL